VLEAIREARERGEGDGAPSEGLDRH
jgi:hypothetical protein